MNGIELMNELNDIEKNNYIIKIFFITIFTSYTIIKITNKKEISKLQIILNITFTIIISIICGNIKVLINSTYSIILLIAMISIINAILMKMNIGYSIVITTIAFSINYILFFVAVLLTFIPTILFKIHNEFINLVIIDLVYSCLIFICFRIKRFKNGILILQNNVKNEYFDILILNLSIIVVVAVIVLSEYKLDFTINLISTLMLFSVIMFITIQKSLQLYYKQKLLIQDLNETKEELEKKKQEIKQLEKENLNFSKKSHSLAHKQRALEYQVNQLLLKSEIAEESNIEPNIESDLSDKTKKEHTNLEELTKVKDEINKLSKEVYNKIATAELSKTGIFEIDNILEYMQSESNKNDIDFNLQITGNIYHMINNIIDKEDLQILLADHIKNAIIAIKHANNINKSILVKLGKIENVYSLYIYDSGIEFEKETLMNLGKKPSTTHAKEGGTGMGFMNTFDTLKKYNASLIINEIGKPSKDNYTKVLIIKFDYKCEFKLTSYRQEEIGEISEKLLDKSTTSDIIVENKS